MLVKEVLVSLLHRREESFIIYRIELEANHRTS